MGQRTGSNEYMLGYFNRKRKYRFLLSISINRNTGFEHLKGFSVLTPNIYDSGPEGLCACVLYCKLFFGLNTPREREGGEAGVGELHSVRTGCRLTPCSHICVVWELNCAVKVCLALAEVIES